MQNNTYLLQEMLGYYRWQLRQNVRENAQIKPEIIATEKTTDKPKEDNLLTKISADIETVVDNNQVKFISQMIDLDDQSLIINQKNINWVIKNQIIWQFPPLVLVDKKQQFFLHREEYRLFKQMLLFLNKSNWFDLLLIMERELNNQANFLKNDFNKNNNLAVIYCGNFNQEKSANHFHLSHPLALYSDFENKKIAFKEIILIKKALSL